MGTGKSIVLQFDKVIEQIFIIIVIYLIYLAQWWCSGGEVMVAVFFSHHNKKPSVDFENSQKPGIICTCFVD